MMMKLDDVVQIGFPDAKGWNRLYAKFQKALVQSLNAAYGLQDREDAVEDAFFKLMHGKSSASIGGKRPVTEKDWFCVLHWKSRAYLSHLKDHADVHARYAAKVLRDFEDVFASGSQGVALDDASRRHRLSCLVGEALQNGVVTRRDLKVFILVRAMEVSPREAAARFRLSTNNVYQITFRVAKALGGLREDSVLREVA